MTAASHSSGSDPAGNRGHAEGVVERACKHASVLALMVLLTVVGVDIVTRWGFNFSYEISDEIGAYMLVAIAFLSLPVSHINGAFHRVEFVQARLSPRARLVSSIGFELLALLFCAILVWQFAGLVRSSWRFGQHAPTLLETPLWVPRLVLVVGMAALCLSLLRSLRADIRRLRSLAAPGQGDGTRRNGS
jgi:TRAP-type C4-dicarboxylate transport system permease small subunit